MIIIVIGINIRVLIVNHYLQRTSKYVVRVKISSPFPYEKYYYYCLIKNLDKLSLKSKPTTQLDWNRKSISDTCCILPSKSFQHNMIRMLSQQHKVAIVINELKHFFLLIKYII